MDTSVYYVQCISGDPSHVMEVIPGSELEEKCKTHAEEGFLDALILGPDDCPNCIEDRRYRDRQFANMCGDCGCPFMSFSDDDQCAQGCMASKASREIKDSPYEDQLRGLPYSTTHADVHELV